MLLTTLENLSIIFGTKKIKKTLSISMVVLFILTVTAAAASARTDPGIGGAIFLGGVDASADFWSEFMKWLFGG